MIRFPPPALFFPNPNWTSDATELFKSIADAMYMTTCLLRDPHLPYLGEKQLSSSHRKMLAKFIPLQSAVDRSTPIPPGTETWDCALAIHAVVEPVYDILRDLFVVSEFTKKKIRKRDLERVRQKLIERRDALDEVTPMRNLHKAIAKDFAIPSTAPQSRRPANDTSPSKLKQRWCYEQYRGPKKLCQIVTSAKRKFGENAPKTEGQVVTYAKRWAKYKNLPIPRRS